jgi:hypothetical protein
MTKINEEQRMQQALGAGFIYQVQKSRNKEILPAGRPPYFLVYEKFGNEKITTQLGDLESYIVSEAQLPSECSEVYFRV